MTQKFVRYSPEVEQEEPDFDRTLQLVLDDMKLIGLQEESATFTIPKDPVRRVVRGIETFNVLRGGEYFFMPSLSALKWLAELRE